MTSGDSKNKKNVFLMNKTYITVCKAAESGVILLKLNSGYEFKTGKTLGKFYKLSKFQFFNL